LSFDVTFGQDGRLDIKRSGKAIYQIYTKTIGKGLFIVYEVMDSYYKGREQNIFKQAVNLQIDYWISYAKLENIEYIEVMDNVENLNSYALLANRGFIRVNEKDIHTKYVLELNEEHCQKYSEINKILEKFFKEQSEKYPTFEAKRKEVKFYYNTKSYYARKTFDFKAKNMPIYQIYWLGQNKNYTVSLLSGYVVFHFGQNNFAHTTIDEVETFLTNHFSEWEKEYRLDDLFEPTFKHLSDLCSSLKYTESEYVKQLSSLLQSHSLKTDKIELIAKNMKEDTKPYKIDYYRLTGKHLYGEIVFQFEELFVFLSKNNHDYKPIVLVSRTLDELEEMVAKKEAELAYLIVKKDIKRVEKEVIF
jgi:hypothetical protein